MTKIDFHIHSNFSDGVLSPTQILERAKQNGVEALSISDHDSVDAYTKEFFDIAQSMNIKIVPAVEMSTKHFGVDVHVLGYGFDLSNKELEECLNKLKNARKNYLLDVSKKLADLGYCVNISELSKLPSVTKAHISKDIVGNIKNHPLLIKNFGQMPSWGEFIETVMNEGCPAYTKKFSISPIEAGKIIHTAGGKVVSAHPVAYAYEDGLSEQQVEQLAKEMKADGIEANYLYVDKFGNLIDETQKWNNFAKRLGLFVTCGSDFHSYDNIHPDIGFTNTTIHLSDEKQTEIVKNLSK